MDAQAVEYARGADVGDPQQTRPTASIKKAAETCAAAGNLPKAIEIAVDIEQLLYETPRSSMPRL
jgi:hypothetical protein